MQNAAGIDRGMVLAASQAKEAPGKLDGGTGVISSGQQGTVMCSAQRLHCSTAGGAWQGEIRDK